MKRQQQSKLQKIWYKYWGYGALILSMIVAGSLILLEQIYKKGYMAINYADYIATTVAIIIISIMIISYFYKLYVFYREDKKLNNRPKR